MRIVQIYFFVLVREHSSIHRNVSALKMKVKAICLMSLNWKLKLVIILLRNKERFL